MKKIKYLAKNFFKAKRMKTLAMLLFCGTLATYAQNAAGDYTAGTDALATVTEEINFVVNPTKYNTCIKSYLQNNNTSYTMNYSEKVNFNNT
ncbi:hypothetical protein [Prevotella sp.]|uniref:hypothetical protein n=1 Tax=Prevotella sp. TaxID=59823 RepID=UPI00402565A0